MAAEIAAEGIARRAARRAGSALKGIGSTLGVRPSGYSSLGERSITRGNPIKGLSNETGLTNTSEGGISNPGYKGGYTNLNNESASAESLHESGYNPAIAQSIDTPASSIRSSKPGTRPLFGGASKTIPKAIPESEKFTVPEPNAEGDDSPFTTNATEKKVPLEGATTTASTDKDADISSSIDKLPEKTATKRQAPLPPDDVAPYQANEPATEDDDLPFKQQRAKVRKIVQDSPLGDVTRAAVPDSVTGQRNIFKGAVDASGMEPEAAKNYKALIDKVHTDTPLDATTTHHITNLMDPETSNKDRMAAISHLADKIPLGANGNQHISAMKDLIKQFNPNIGEDLIGMTENTPEEEEALKTMNKKQIAAHYGKKVLRGTGSMINKSLPLIMMMLMSKNNKGTVENINTVDGETPYSGTSSNAISNTPQAQTTGTS